MSGAELIVILGITSSVVSIVDACSKILDRIEAFRQSLAFQDLVVQLPLLINVIEGLDTPKYRELLDESTKQALARVLEGCLRQLRRLEKLIQSMTPAEAASKFEKTWKGIRSFGKDTKLREILGALSEYKSTITLHLSSVHVQNTQKSSATPDATKSYFDVPSTRLSHFVGRSEVFGRIQSTIDSSSIYPPVIVLTGAGGQGKTQVALEFCHRNANVYQGVFWIDSSSEASATRSYEKILKSLSGEALSGESHDPKTTVKSILRDWKEPWLLVFDNYDNPNSFQKLSSFFPGPNGACKSAILVTSRHVSSARLGMGIPLTGLSEEDGLELLLSRSSATPTSALTAQDSIEGKEIVKKLGYLALAIDQAAAYISIRQLPLQIFVEHFERRKEFILKSTPQSLWEYRTRTSDDTNDGSQNLSVLTTWELSFDQISGSDEERIQIGEFLMQAAFFDPGSVSEALFSNFHQYDHNETLVWKPAFETNRAWDAFQFQDVVVGLVNLSLVQGLNINREGVSFSLHPLIKDWLQLRGQLESRQRRTSTAIAMTSSLLQSFETEKLSLLTRQEFLGHIDACMDNCGRYLTTDESLVKYGGFLEGFQTTFATFYGEHDRYKDAEELFLKSLSLQKHKLGFENIATLSTLNNLGALYLGARQLDKAKDYLVLAIQVKESLLGPHHPRTLNSVNNIGNLLVLQMKYDEANQMYKRTLEGYSKINGPMHKTVLEALNNLGEVAMKKGSLHEAEKIFKEAFNKACTISGGKYDALVLYLASNVALVYKLQQRYQESIQTYADVVAGREKLLGEKHSSTLQSMCEVADVYKALGEEQSANKWYQRGNASQERRQRGEPWPKQISKPISEATMSEKSGENLLSQLSLEDNAVPGPSKLNGSNNDVTPITGQGDQMEWESDTLPFIDRGGRERLQVAPLSMRRQAPLQNQQSGVTNYDRGGHSFSQLAPPLLPPTTTDDRYANIVDPSGRPGTNVDGVDLLQYDQARTTSIRGSFPQSLSPAYSSIDRAGIGMPQQASSGPAFGSDIGRWGRPNVNVGGVDMLQVGQGSTPLSDERISHPASQAIPFIERTGLRMQQAIQMQRQMAAQQALDQERQQILKQVQQQAQVFPSSWGPLSRPHATPSVSAFGSGLDRAGMPSWNDPPTVPTRAPVSTAASSNPYFHQPASRAGLRVMNPNYEGPAATSSSDSPPITNSQSSWSSVPSILETSRPAERQVANDWIDRSGWMNSNSMMPSIRRPSEIASIDRGGRSQANSVYFGGEVQMQTEWPARSNPAPAGQLSPNARPRSNCEYIERGGMCIHNVFHGQ